MGNVPTHLSATVNRAGGYTPCGANEKVTAMCTMTISMLTMAGMLQDPLIRLVMHSDGVSEQDMSNLLNRVKDSLEAREAPVALPLPVQAGCRLAATI
jgi:hypothetical protein